jgi:hypothetical protein
MLFDTDYMNTVLHLYSQVVNLFDDQNTNDVSLNNIETY